MKPEKDIILKVKPRDKTGHKITRKYKKINKIPAVIYGKSYKNQNLEVNQKEFFSLEKHFSENTILTLEFPDKKSVKALVHETDLDPVTDKIVHIDFLKIDPKRKIEAQVPVKFINDSKAVKEENGLLIKNLNEISVECLPTDIPEFIEADLSKLVKLDDHIKISDLQIDDKVEIKGHNPDDVVATVTEQKEEIIEEPKKEEEEKAEGEEGEAKEGEEAQEGEEAKPKEGEQAAEGDQQADKQDQDKAGEKK